MFLLQVHGARAVLQLYPENSEQVNPLASGGTGKGEGPRIGQHRPAPHPPALLLLGGDGTSNLRLLGGKGGAELLGVVPVAPAGTFYDLVS